MLAVQLPVQLYGGRLVGDTIGSTELVFEPRKTPFSSIHFQKGDTKTAGSICLLLQAWLPCALFGTGNVDRYTVLLCGGTNASMAPQYDYWEQVFLPVLRDVSALDPDQISATLLRRGYFPKGGGKVQVECRPLRRSLRPIRLTERGEVTRIYIRTYHTGRIPRQSAEFMAMKAKEELIPYLPRDVEYEIDILSDRDGIGTGSGILIVATTSTGCRLAGSALSTPKISRLDVVSLAVNDIRRALAGGGCVDEWLQDQLILYMALADGVSEIHTGCLSLHTRTAIWVAEQLIPAAKFEVIARNGTHEGKDGMVEGPHIIRCQGIGFRNDAVNDDASSS